MSIEEFFLGTRVSKVDSKDKNAGRRIHYFYNTIEKVIYPYYSKIKLIRTSRSAKTSQIIPQGNMKIELIYKWLMIIGT